MRESRIFERADFSKPKPNFDWSELESLREKAVPTIPSNAICLQDVMDRFGVRARTAQTIVTGAISRGVLKKISGWGKGWYVKP